MRQLVKKPPQITMTGWAVEFRTPIAREWASTTSDADLASVLLMNFYEKERKREIPFISAFANAEQDWQMPLILQGKDFQGEFPFISAT
jgi:hypothetical protein